MKHRELKFTLQVFENLNELSNEDAALLQKAKGAIAGSYSPYSKFKVAAAILLANGEVVIGSNQENAASPAGICAEGTALSTASSLYPFVPVSKIAITAKSEGRVVKHPITPCGICRQRLLEYEIRFNAAITIVMAGEEGEIFSVETVKDILPLNFSSADL
jgi:cytidine deaminase